MNETAVVLTLKKGRAVARVEGTRVTLGACRCLAFDDSPEDKRFVDALGTHLATLTNAALVGPQHAVDYLFRLAPRIREHFCSIVITPDLRDHPIGNPARGLVALPPTATTAFVVEPAAFPRMALRAALPSHVAVQDLSVLAEIAPSAIPRRGWLPLPTNIYPIDVPQIEVKRGLDLVLVDCPSRNLALMPNGLAYVNNALKKTSVSHQILDLDIIAYHRFHLHRLYDMGGRAVLPSGRVLPEDPWQAEHYDVWASGAEHASRREGSNEIVEFFRPLIEEAVDAIVAARPKVLGLSIQQCNEAFSRELVRGVKSRLPEIVVLVGGFSCYNADIGRRAFPECDYMCIGEADLTVGPLVESLARGERPFDQPGVLSRYDSASYRYIPAPMVHNLDKIEFPKYEWCDLGVYRNFNDYQLTPIIASRGCRWSRCTFCAERFYWRIRSPENFVDELEWLIDRGCHLYMFNESDLNGMPERVMEICDEIIRRGLHRKVKLTGQLRIHKKSSRAFFQKLRDANFVALRFGVDAFSANTLRLQKKGYTVDMIAQNLKDCWECGIYTEVNWVIGVPGETDADVEEGIQLILANRKHIGRLSNINPLILVNGSVYWIDPAAHNIVFKEPREELYAKYPRAIPADLWYSTDPYIDAQVRKERFERIVVALHDAGFPVGAWANRIIEDVKLARDPNRATAPKAGAHAHDSQTEPRPGAQPPLFGVAGAAPRLVRTLETHNVLFYDGWYYGIPHALGDVDLSRPDLSSVAGVVRLQSESDVIAVIEEASRWANTRGQYDAQDKQRAAGSYLRADSALGESRLGNLPEQPKILRVHGEYIAVDEESLGDAFSPLRLRSRARSPGKMEMPAERPDTSTLSPLRRIAFRLSPAVQQEIRRLIRIQSLNAGTSTGATTAQSDRDRLKLLCRGVVQEYVKRPLARIIAAGAWGSGKRAILGTPVPGEDFRIVSAITKNALPELMWPIADYNLVKFDGTFYGVPQGTPIDWDAGEVAAQPGVFVGRTIREVVTLIERTLHVSEDRPTTARHSAQASGPAGASTRTPVVLRSLEGYTVVSYEGWVYGLPRSLGAIDLTEVDVMDMSGVIRDVSQDVVENEILERARAGKSGVSA